MQGFAETVIPAPGDPGSGPDFESFVAEFPGGGMVQIAFGRYHRNTWREASRFLPQPGFQVYAERGAAWLELPERIQLGATAVYDVAAKLQRTAGDQERWRSISLSTDCYVAR